MSAICSFLLQLELLTGYVESIHFANKKVIKLFIFKYLLYEPVIEFTK
jgi:hypothetical protein